MQLKKQNGLRALLLNGLAATTSCMMLLAVSDATFLAQARKDGMNRNSAILIRIAILIYGVYWMLSVDLYLYTGAPSEPSSPASPASSTASTASVTRSKRSYDQLGPTQKWKRKKRAREAVAQLLDEIGVPPDAITPPSTPSPADLVHLPTSVREAIRTVPALHIPCEQTMIQCKKQLATSHATKTGTFVGGAYITDPVRFVSVLCAQSSFIAAVTQEAVAACWA